MTSRRRSRPFLATGVTALAVFLAVLVLLAVRMASGHDPSLGAGVSAPVSTPVTQQQPSEPYAAKSYDDDVHDEQSGGAAAEPPTGQAPLRSGTS